MSDQNSALISQLMQRNQILAAGTGQQQPVQAPPIQVSLPQPAPTEAPRMQMTPAERELFMRQTGVRFNPYALDIELKPSLEELLQRADAIIHRYKEQ